MNKQVRLGAMSGVAVAVMLMSGCAAIVGGMHQPVAVSMQTGDGDPIDGANCRLQNSKGTWYVTTPGSVTIHRGHDNLRVSCSKPTTGAGEMTQRSTVSGWVFGNLVLGGLIGLIVDLGTDAGFNYPDSLLVVQTTSKPDHSLDALPGAPADALASRSDAPASAATATTAPSPAGTIPPGPDLTAARGPAGLAHARGEVAQAPLPPAPQPAPSAATNWSVPVTYDTGNDTPALPPVRRSVTGGPQGGMPVMVAAHADADAICKTSGLSPQVQIIEPSAHGEIGIFSGQFDAPDAESAAVCPGGKLFGTQIFYKPASDYHGADRLRYVVVTAKGRFTREVDIDVQ